MGYLTSKEIRHKLKIALHRLYGVTNNLIKKCSSNQCLNLLRNALALLAFGMKKRLTNG